MNGPIVGAWEGEEVGSMLARLGRDSPLKSLWCIAERTRRLDQLLREEGGGGGREGEDRRAHFVDVLPNRFS
jgi:hypothetical protein